LESDPTKHINCSEVHFHHYRDGGKGTQNTKRNLEILKTVWEECNEAEKPRYSFYLAKEYTYSGLIDEAIEMFKTYIPISNWLPEKHRAMFELAHCYKVKGDLENAKRYCFEAIQLDERYADPYLTLATLAYERKDYKMCAAWCSMIYKLEKPETYFFDFLPITTYLPADYMAIAYWHYDKEKGKEAVDKCLYYKPHEKRFLFNWGQYNAVPKIAIIIPTLNREERLAKCIEKIKENTFILGYEILIGVDGNPEYYTRLVEKYKDDKSIKIYLYPKSGVAEVVESLIDETDATYVTFIGDDVEVERGWLIYAYKACQDKNLVALNDSVWKGEIACHWFAPKSLRDKLGGFFFHKSYHHVGCDNELTEKAKKLGCYAFAENAYIKHVHYIQAICSDKNNVAVEDECYKIGWNEESVKKDRALLDIRKKNNYLSDSETLNVIIGSGTTSIAGYITLDKYSKTANIQRDILEEGIFNPESVDKFLAEHILEHFIQEDGEKLIKICYAALKTGGTLEIAVPDMCRIMEVTDEEYRRKVMYGHQRPGMHHKFGYSLSSLKALLEKFNFIIISDESCWHYDAPECRVVGRK
jgi:predicted SAM-dependent methyltransferase